MAEARGLTGHMVMNLSLDPLIYRPGDKLDAPLLLRDGVVRLWIGDPPPCNPRRFIILDWIIPGMVFGEEFAFGVAASCYASEARKGTWYTPVTLTPHAALSLAVGRAEKAHEYMLDVGRNRLKHNLMKLLLNQPISDLTRTEMSMMIPGGDWRSIRPYLDEMEEKGWIEIIRRERVRSGGRVVVLQPAELEREIRNYHERMRYRSSVNRMKKNALKGRLARVKG